MTREEADRLIYSENNLFSDELAFDLEERSDLINKHKDEVAYICKLLGNYIEDVNRIINGRMPSSMVSHLTYNLIHNLVSCLIGLTTYDYLNTSYLLPDNYDDNYILWAKFSESAKVIRILVKKLEDINYYNISIHPGVLNLIPKDNTDKNAVYSLLNLEHTLSLINGEGLFNALLYYMRALEEKLETIKTGINNLTDDDFKRIYYANYALYYETYWVNECKNFRHHIEANYFRGRESKIDVLERLLREEKSDFQRNPTGALWRDYFDDKKKLYFEMRRANLNEDQWKYFFKFICRFEEYEKWIDELEHPQKEGEEFLESEWDKIFNDAIDVKKVKQTLPKLLPKTISITTWYIIYKIFVEIDWLQKNISVHFISWVKDVYGWNFKTEDFKSSVNSELKQQHTLDWNTRTMTSAKIAKDYIDFANSVRNEFVLEMDGKTVKEDNKNYFKKPDLYIKHKRRQ